MPSNPGRDHSLNPVCDVAASDKSDDGIEVDESTSKALFTDSVAWTLTAVVLCTCMLCKHVNDNVCCIITLKCNDRQLLLTPMC